VPEFTCPGRRENGPMERGSTLDVLAGQNLSSGPLKALFRESDD
jgi:hypothetical protein